MTHAQRQAFLKTSQLGKLLGVAHLLSSVDAQTEIEKMAAIEYGKQGQ